MGARSTVTLGLGMAAIAAAGVPVAAASSSPLVKRSSGPLTATLRPSSHTPKVNRNWPITVTATLHGKAAHATAKYEFLYSGQVVATQYPYNNKHYHFTGHFHDNLVFPPSAVGQPVTLAVVIAAGGHQVSLDWAIRTKK
jgi:hypothetical protein